MSDARTDEAVLEAYRSGEAGALEVLIRRYHDDVMRFLYRLLGDRNSAEDVFQETFLQIHLSADTFDASRRFKPWLFTIAANKARDHLRRSSRRRTLDLSAPVPGKGGSSGGGGDSDGPAFVDLLQIHAPSPGEVADLAERDKLVQRAISELPLTLREVLLLAYFQRQSYNDIAESLQIPLGTVKSRLHAAVAAFARRWQQVSGTDTPDRGGRVA
ncbi:MAG: RNA polymerase sigma factor [Phycisphaerales bacterium]